MVSSIAIMEYEITNYPELRDQVGRCLHIVWKGSKRPTKKQAKILAPDYAKEMIIYPTLQGWKPGWSIAYYEFSQINEYGHDRLDCPFASEPAVIKPTRRRYSL